VLVAKEEPKTTTTSPQALIEEARQLQRDDPQALIEEARQLQRQRARRRTVVIQSAALLVILGFGINQFARGGNSASTAPQQPLTNAAQTPTVTYKKIVSQSFGPHVRIKKQTVQVWSSSATPDVVRAIVTFPGHGHGRYEFGLVYKHDKVYGIPEREIVFYFYDAPTNTIYRIGSTLGTLTPLPPPIQILNQVLAAPFARLEGTRTYQGRAVDVVVIQDPHSAVSKQTVYLDKRTHEIVRSDVVFTNNSPLITPLTVLDRAQQRKLPATKPNLALTSLQAAHPGARIARAVPPRVQRMNGALPYFDSDAYIEMLMR
jgi:hypothetical protein